MKESEIFDFYQKTIDELKPIHEKLNTSGKLDLTEDNLYIALSFVSKITGLNSIFDDSFIEEYNLKSVVDWIDKKTVMIQASHYQDKGLFYEFINVIYPQLQYRFSQIKYLRGLSKEERSHLKITAEYQVYLYQLLKYYLEQPSTKEVQDNIKEILSIVNLYKIISDPNCVALGSEITYMDTINNEIYTGRIVINSHANVEHHKLALKDYKELIGAKKEDIVCLDYSTSYFIRILDIKNEEEKPRL